MRLSRTVATSARISIFKCGKSSDRAYPVNIIKPVKVEEASRSKLRWVEDSLLAQARCLCYSNDHCWWRRDWA